MEPLQLLILALGLDGVLLAVDSCRVVHTAASGIYDTGHDYEITCISGGTCRPVVKDTMIREAVIGAWCSKRNC